MKPLPTSHSLPMVERCWSALTRLTTRPAELKYGPFQIGNGLENFESPLTMSKNERLAFHFFPTVGGSSPYPTTATLNSRDLNARKAIQKFSVPASRFTLKSRRVLSATGERLISVEKDALKIWDTITGTSIQSFAISSEIKFAHFSRDAKLVLASGENEISVYEIESRKVVSTIRQHAADAAFAADGKSVFVLHYGGTISEWDTQTGQQKRVVTMALGSPWSLVLSPTDAMRQCLV